MYGFRTSERLLSTLEYYGSATASFFRRYWPLIVSMLCIIGLITFEITIRSCSEESPPPPEQTTDLAQEMILEQLEADRIDAQQKIEALENEIKVLNERLDYVDVEISNNVKNRKVTHAKLKKALTISDIDTIMQAEFSKHSSTAANRPAEGVSTNPY